MTMKGENMRPTFFRELHKQMTFDQDIVAITMDLGYGGWDQIAKDYPKRFFNVGAAEQAGMDIAVGMAQDGKKVFVYSITPFLIYRAFETLRTYVNYERVPIKLVGSGRDTDYAHDGWSHDASDVKQILDTLPNIKQLYPETKEEIPELVKQMVDEDQPIFISLAR